MRLGGKAKEMNVGGLDRCTADEHDLLETDGCAAAAAAAAAAADGLVTAANAMTCDLMQTF